VSPAYGLQKTVLHQIITGVWKWLLLVSPSG